VGSNPTPSTKFLKLKFNKMSTKTTSKTVSKGNKTTEVILGSAALKLESAVKALLGATEEVSKIEARASECTLEVTNLEDQIGGLKQQLVNDKNQNKLDLELQYKADQRSFATTWLQENSYTFLPAQELQDLKNKLSKATMEVDQTVNKAVSAATSALTSKHETELKMKDMEYKTSEATNLATIKQLQAEVAVWKNQAEQWQKALDNERQASISRAQASSITQNIGGNGK
jgi:predicted  nucleic acid-binding Zn-ribbon protein